MRVNDEQKKHSGIGRIRELKDNLYTIDEIVEKPGA
jgi:hypothetical protein